MKLLSLGLMGTTDELRYKLQQDCTMLAQKGFHLALDETSKGNLTFIGCNITEEQLSFHSYERYKDTIVSYVARNLTDLIIFKEEPKLVRKIIDQNYYYFNDDERHSIFCKTITLLGNSPQLPLDFTVNERKSIILTKLLKYLEHNHEIVIDGFINFRLKDYKKRLVDIIDKVVDEYMMDLEYKEFIRVLKYFVEVQEPRIAQVHVVVSDSGTFKIIDSGGTTVSQNPLENLISNAPNEINYEDLLISTLITIAPYSITIHNVNEDKMPNVIETIKMIFQERVIVCPGCDICKKT